MTLTELTPEQEARAIDVFSRRKKVQFRLLIPAGIAILLAVAANFFTWFAVGPVTNSDFVYIFLGVVALIIVYYRFNWRCPVCSIHLGRLYNIKKCPRCGVKLQRE
jgi:hypothetical protein